MANDRDDLNTRVVLLTLQDHVDAGRSPVEAAGEVLFLEAGIVKEAILSEESAAENRRIVEGWLAKTLNLAPEDVGAHMAQADDYASFLRERVTIGKGLEWMRTIEKTWREWRRTRAHERDS